jgi:hypothetical protein
MIDFLLGAIVTGCAIYIGFALGKNSSIIPEETKRQVKRLIQALPIKKDIGMVERPTAHQIENYNNPIQKAEEEEMNKTFSEIVPKQ